MFRIHSRAFALMVLVALAFAVASVACGGGDDNDEKTPSGNGSTKTEFDLQMNEGDGNQFVLDGKKNPALTVSAGAKITINLDNDGSAIHNMRFAGDDNRYNTGDDAVSKPDIVSPGDKAVLVFTAPKETGKYLYQCDFHPTDMLGEIEVVK